MKDFHLKVLDEYYEVFSKWNSQLENLKGKYKLCDLSWLLQEHRSLFLYSELQCQRKKYSLRWLIKAKAEFQKEVKTWDGIPRRGLMEDTCKSKHQYSSMLTLGQSRNTFRLKDLVIRKHVKMPPLDQHLINFSKYEAIFICQNMNIL